MVSKAFWWKTAIFLGFGAGLWGGNFGQVVSIGGQAADLALDEPRGVLYVANFTANRIELVSLTDYSIQTSINVAPQPSSLALSPDDRFLLVAHYGNNAAPGTPANALTVIDLNANTQQVFTLGAPPLGVAFGIDGKALVVTNTDFVLFDPVLGTSTELTTIAGLVANTLPQPPATFPPTIVGASVNVSGDGLTIYGLGGTILFRYDVTSQSLSASLYTSSPPLGPRVVSVSQDGSYFTAGWALKDNQFYNRSQFANPSGVLNVGSTLIDSSRNLIYSQVETAVASSATGTGTTTTGTTGPPIMQLVASDNLTMVDQIQLPENLAGKSVLSSDNMTMYGISDSGVLVLPVGSLNQAHRLPAFEPDVVFRGNFCDRQVNTQTLTIVDPGGGNTAFTISSNTAGLSVNPSSGVTPATISVSVDPSVFASQKGTVTASLTLQSSQAVNVPGSVRVLINSQDPAQRGTFVNVPGTLVDLLPDPGRNRFYVLRQDQNQVQVYDASNNTLIATLRTGNTPKGMAITFDDNYLLVGCDNSHYLWVYDLTALQPVNPVRMSGGDYVQSVAASANAILAVTRSAAGGAPAIHRINLQSGTSTKLPSLGTFQNIVNLNSVLSASPNGSSILMAGADGSVLLYDANSDTFTVSRKDYTTLSGAYAASSYNQFVVGNYLLDSSLVSVGQFETGTGAPSGFAFVDQFGYRTTAPSSTTGISSAPGNIESLDLSSPSNATSVGHATSIVEAPLLGITGAAFTRTLAPLSNQSGIINLTVSGFTVLPWAYAAASAIPTISQLVNAADGTSNIAPGGLISLYGQQLSPVNMATSQIPLPTAVASSCLTVNGLPIPILFVSPNQINAQMPFATGGNISVILHTPAGVSDTYNATLLATAPSVFSAMLPGLDTPVATIFRNSNGQMVTGSNPVHTGDVLTIYATGLGQTSPAGQTGTPAPNHPLASALTAPVVTLGSATLQVLYAGLAPGEIGVYQINVQIPNSAPQGLSIPLKITQGSVSTSIPVRVIQ
jgi:uncharacterized protein (TIGR03437 family)